MGDDIDDLACYSSKLWTTASVNAEHCTQGLPQQQIAMPCLVECHRDDRCFFSSDFGRCTFCDAKVRGGMHSTEQAPIRRDRDYLPASFEDGMSRAGLVVVRSKAWLARLARAC